MFLEYFIKNIIYTPESNYKTFRKQNLHVIIALLISGKIQGRRGVLYSVRSNQIKLQIN